MVPRLKPMILAVSLFAATVPGWTAPKAEELTFLDDGWEYLWSSAETPPADGAWKAAGFPSNPPGREGRTMVWYRIRLPAGEYRDPRLYVFSIDLNAEFFLDGTSIYSFGQINPPDFVGWPWHLVELPPDYSERELAVRVSSDYRDIGLWGTVILGSGFDIQSWMFRRDILPLIISIVSLCISIIFLVVFLLNRSQRNSLYISLTTFFLILRVLCQAHVRTGIIDNPLVWEYVKVLSTSIIPVFIALFLRTVVEKRLRWLTNSVLVAFIGAFAFGIIGPASGLVELPSLYGILDWISILAVLILGTLLIRSSIRRNMEARILLLSFLPLSILVFYGILMSHDRVPWVPELDYLVLFQFSLGLSLVLARRFLLVNRALGKFAHRSFLRFREARDFNERLERLVEDRTKQLSKANEALEKERSRLLEVSITDSLTGLYNRRYTEEMLGRITAESRRYGTPLSVVLFDLDNFKNINDLRGHQLGDRVLKGVGEIFREISRDSDIAGRYGGEEFLLILPRTEWGRAVQVAERIRREITERLRPVEIEVTISGGVAELDGHSPEGLVQEADKRMYRAKQLGKNRIVAM
ncbi:MAG: diguanylate cyclase [Spirochaetia bacterium]